jgi:hypothetical protein
MGTGGRQQSGGPACDLCDGFKCPHESDANSPCDVFAFSVSQHRAKEIIDDPPLKGIHRQESQTQRQSRDQLPATYGVAEAEAGAVRRPQGNALRRSSPQKGGKGESAQSGRPIAANAHSAPSKEYEQQLDEGLEWLEKMRGEFGN